MSIIHKLPYEWQVGLRYTRAGKSSGRSSFISFISLISVAGIALGVAAPTASSTANHAARIFRAWWAEPRPRRYRNSAMIPS